MTENSYLDTFTAEPGDLAFTVQQLEKEGLRLYGYAPTSFVSTEDPNRGEVRLEATKITLLMEVPFDSPYFRERSPKAAEGSPEALPTQEAKGPVSEPEEAPALPGEALEPPVDLRDLRARFTEAVQEANQRNAAKGKEWLLAEYPHLKSDGTGFIKQLSERDMREGIAFIEAKRISPKYSRARSKYRSQRARCEALGVRVGELKGNETAEAILKLAEDFQKAEEAIQGRESETEPELAGASR